MKDYHLFLQPLNPEIHFDQMGEINNQYISIIWYAVRCAGPPNTDPHYLMHSLVYFVDFRRIDVFFHEFLLEI